MLGNRNFFCSVWRLEDGEGASMIGCEVYLQAQDCQLWLFFFFRERKGEVERLMQLLKSFLLPHEGHNMSSSTPWCNCLPLQNTIILGIIFELILERYSFYYIAFRKSTFDDVTTLWAGFQYILLVGNIVWEASHTWILFLWSHVHICISLDSLCSSHWSFSMCESSQMFCFYMSELQIFLHPHF